MIAIKGMKMPKSGYDCPAMDDSYGSCAFFELRGHEDWCSNFMRPYTCPLVEVKGEVEEC